MDKHTINLVKDVLNLKENEDLKKGLIQVCINVHKANKGGNISDKSLEKIETRIDGILSDYMCEFLNQEAYDFLDVYVWGNY